MRHLTSIGWLVAFALLVAAPPAQAATVGQSASAPGTFNYRAAAGETNVLDISAGRGPSGAPTTTFTDAVTILLAGAACSRVTAIQAACVGENANLDVALRDGDDSARIRTPAAAIVSGGPGDDTVDADSFSQWTRVYGDAGDDNITAGGEGTQFADGGAGDDVIHTGGTGAAAGFGGGGRDIIFYNPGLAGRATLEGNGGADTIIAQPSGASGNTAAGGDGDDVIVVNGVAPPHFPDGSFTLTGGAGDDTLIGGPFPDSIDGGDGRDYIDVAGGDSDTVSCGAGMDIVRYDSSDILNADCEIQLPN